MKWWLFGSVALCLASAGGILHVLLSDGDVVRKQVSTGVRFTVSPLFGVLFMTTMASMISAAFTIRRMLFGPFGRLVQFLLALTSVILVPQFFYGHLQLEATGIQGRGAYWFEPEVVEVRYQNLTAIELHEPLGRGTRISKGTPELTFYLIETSGDIQTLKVSSLVRVAMKDLRAVCKQHGIPLIDKTANGDLARL